MFEKKDDAHMPVNSKSSYRPRLLKFYEDVVHSKMVEQFSYSNSLQVPKLCKIVLNMGVGKAALDSKKINMAERDLSLIAGQKPIVTKAHKSISTFKLKEGMPIGVKVTLRKNKMYEFLDRLINISLPRVRDFRGMNSKSFDGMGNFSMGIKEHLIFPEIDYDKTDSVLGMDIVICTTAVTDNEARALLSHFNFPFN